MPGDPLRADARQATSGRLSELLSAIFSHVPPGYIEVRVIGDDRVVLWRGWYPDRARLAYELTELAKEAAEHRAGVFFGVIPRRAEGVGSATDTLPGLTLWADIDFKDFSGGEKEARERISAFPLSPSIVVRSGHGLHLYWLLSELTEPALIARLNQRIAQFLGADRAFDAARVLRLPGTWNMKDPSHPVLVEIEHMDVQ